MRPEKQIADSRVLNLIQQMLKAGYEEKGQRFETPRRSSTDAHNVRASSSLRQWQIASSAYRSNGMFGSFRAIHMSNV
jgi:hypothetical protein